jgi:hypothetical protein
MAEQAETIHTTCSKQIAWQATRLHKPASKGIATRNIAHRWESKRIVGLYAVLPHVVQRNRCSINAVALQLVLVSVIMDRTMSLTKQEQVKAAAPTNYGANATVFP